MAAEETEAKKKTTRLGDFELKRKLGQGGMGAVYLAHQISLDRPCALKIMSKELAAKPGFVERFKREARSMAKVDHPHVVTCYAVGEEGGHHYVAMELMDGKSMQDWANQVGALSVADALLVTIVCGEALHYAHEKNMVHRDVKPDNILVTKKGVVKVSDLGLAKAVDEEDLALTQSGTGLGTPHYMAPEQARNAKHVDRRCDVYALGCTLYYLLTGKTPFKGESLVELIQSKVKGQFTPPRQINKNIPDKLNLIIEKSMMVDANHRYQSCGEFVKDLESLGLAGESLSFIEGGSATVLRRANGPHQRTAVNKNHPTLPAANAPAKAPIATGDWYVQTEEAGKIKVGKMTTAQVLTALKQDRLGEKTRASTTSKGPFNPLAQIPVFEDETRKMLTRKAAAARSQDLAKQYNQLAKQYDRQWIWRYLRSMVDGTLGFVGLLLWLGLFVGIGVGIYLLWPLITQMFLEQAGVKT